MFSFSSFRMLGAWAKAVAGKAINEFNAALGSSEEDELDIKYALDRRLKSGKDDSGGVFNADEVLAENASVPVDVVDAKLDVVVDVVVDKGVTVSSRSNAQYSESTICELLSVTGCDSVDELLDHVLHLSDVVYESTRNMAKAETTDKSRSLLLLAADVVASPSLQLAGTIEMMDAEISQQKRIADSAKEEVKMLIAQVEQLQNRVDQLESQDAKPRNGSGSKDEEVEVLQGLLARAVDEKARLCMQMDGLVDGGTVRGLVAQMRLEPHQRDILLNSLCEIVGLPPTTNTANYDQDDGGKDRVLFVNRVLGFFDN